ncbi:MAG: hypothetical protein BTN85_1467 [Candidatus Methanohalarchaeum thermophilum]|uniref:Uncharacterized protein n=1 Tax=Methanohalarchaeum thermophilum TaxID=1903181 RepID=A0A1Q6DXC6_METT1|nr:MAG: hypothetical protein BTN85_1467 [Candidatus Methanohalarchaeum thermophilum]
MSLTEDIKKKLDDYYYSEGIEKIEAAYLWSKDFNGLDRTSKLRYNSNSYFDSLKKDLDSICRQNGQRPQRVKKVTCCLIGSEFLELISELIKLRMIDLSKEGKKFAFLSPFIFHRAIEEISSFDKISRETSICERKEPRLDLDEFKFSYEITFDKDPIRDDEFGFKGIKELIEAGLFNACNCYEKVIIPTQSLEVWRNIHSIIKKNKRDMDKRDRF